MGKILEALTKNELYATEIVQNPNPKRKELLKKNEHLYNKLLQNLNDEEKNILEQLLDVISDENYFDIQYNFIRGFSLGTLMTTEIFSEQDSFL